MLTDHSYQVHVDAPQKAYQALREQIVVRVNSLLTLAENGWPASSYGIKDKLSFHFDRSLKLYSCNNHERQFGTHLDRLPVPVGSTIPDVYISSINERAVTARG